VTKPSLSAAAFSVVPSLCAVLAIFATLSAGAPQAFLPYYILGLVASAKAKWTDADAALRRGPW
jgi:hypothetical protein